MPDEIGIVSVGKHVESLDRSNKLAPYTKVRIIVNDSDVYEAESESGNGRTLEIENPFGSQQMANEMLAKLQGKQYQPFEAVGAQVDPAAEIGDGISVNGVYSGLYKSRLTYSALMSSDVGAPFEEEIDNEYKWESETERRYTRQIKELRASLILAGGKIEAKVDRFGPDSGGFGWELTDTGHKWFANNDRENPVMEVTATKLTVRGKIESGEGHIGGFTITNTTLSNYANSKGIWMSSEPWPVAGESYNDVLQIGANFHVKNDGSIVANNGTFNGTVRAGNIQYGGDNGYFNGGGIAGGSVGVSQLSTYAGGGVEGGVSFNKTTDPYTTTRPDGYFGRLSTTRLSTGGYDWGTQTLQYKDHNGNNRSVVILAGHI